MRTFNLTDAQVLDSLDRPAVEQFEGEALAILADPPQWLHRPPADLQQGIFALLLSEDRADRDAKSMQERGASDTANRLRESIGTMQASRAEFTQVAMARIAEAYRSGEAMPDMFKAEPERFMPFLNAEPPAGLDKLEDRADALDKLMARAEVAEWWKRTNGSPDAEEAKQFVLQVGMAKNRLMQPLAKARADRDAEALVQQTQRRARLKREAEAAHLQYVQESERLRKAALAAAERAGISPADVIQHPTAGSA